MSFREKIAWLSLTAMVVAYGVYFTLISPAFLPAGASTGYFLALLGGILTVQAVLVTIASIVLAIQTGRDANAPADERERAIARRGAAIAYFVLMVGIIVVGCVMPFSAGGWHIVNAALLALVASEIVRYGVIVVSYRRGWHG
jgi:hypothetical protein